MVCGGGGGWGENPSTSSKVGGGGRRARSHPERNPGNCAPVFHVSITILYLLTSLSSLYSLYLLTSLQQGRPVQ